MKILIVINLISLVSSMNQSVGDVMTDLKALCPYTTFCTTAAEKELQVDNKNRVPCCTPCSCSPSCWRFGTCCPDIEQSMPSKPEIAVCQHNFQNFSFNPVALNDNKQLNVQYRMIKDCPTDYIDVEDIVSKCENYSQSVPQSFDDIVLVSDALEHDDIYRNRYCAACHGVTNVIRWDLAVATCDTPFFDANRAMSELFEFVIYNCIVISIPSTNVSLTQRSSCNTVEIISSCNETGLMETFDVQIEKQCNASYFPYFETTPLRIYRNVGCFICNKPNASPGSEICLSDQLSRTVISSNFRAILDFNLPDLNEIQETVGNCNEMQIYDSFMRVCRPFRCSVLSSPFYGSCLPISILIDDLTVIFPIRLTLIGDEWSPDILSHDDGSIYDSLTDISIRLVRRLSLHRCLQCDVNVDAYINGTQNVPTLTLTFQMETNNDCQLSAIIEALNQFDINPIFTLKTDTSSIGVQASVDFTNHSNSETFYKVWLFPNGHHRCSNDRLTLTELSICPYITMDLKEYLDYLVIIGRHNIYIDNTEDNIILLPGFYYISMEPTIVATCIDTMAMFIPNKSPKHQTPLLYEVLCFVLSYLLF